jgi:hypothetical protein
MMKPGVKTSEFWVALAVSVVGVLLALGVLTPDQAEVVEGELTRTINSIFDALLIAAPQVAYIWSRGKAKAGK